MGIDQNSTWALRKVVKSISYATMDWFTSQTIKESHEVPKVLPIHAWATIITVLKTQVVGEVQLSRELPLTKQCACVA